VGVPLLFLVNTSPSAEYFVRCTIVFVVCMSILLLIFIPKVWHLYKNRALSPLSRSTSHLSGLTFRVVDKNAMIEQEARIRAIKQKLNELKMILKSEGLDADEILERAGLACHLKLSTAVSDSKVEGYPGDRAGTGGITASSGAESLVSIQKSSGFETSDDDCDNGTSFSMGGKRVSFVSDQKPSRNESIEEVDEDDCSAAEAGGAEGEGDEEAAIPSESAGTTAEARGSFFSRLEI
jgi:hypothetical protein